MDARDREQIRLKNGLLLILRDAEPDDAERLLGYVEQIASESDNVTMGPGEFGMSVEDERVYLKQVAEIPTSLYLIAEIEGEIVGMLSFSAGRRPRVRHVGEFGTSVLRTYWNLGIGYHMLNYLIDWAKGTDIIRKINLRVRIDNLPAIHLYEKHGFVHEGRVTRELYIHGQFVDVFAMGLELDPK